MYFLYLLLFIALVVSFIADRNKTYRAIKIAFKKFTNILPAFTAMLVLVSVILGLVPESLIVHYLGKSNMFKGVLMASFFGSITLMPGFIAFPLCGILLKEGVTYTVISAFTTTMMMVGIVTFPIEKSYFGWKVAVMRNALSLFIALIVAVITGIIFVEILL